MQKSLITIILTLFLSISAFSQNQNNEINRWSSLKAITVSGEILNVQHPLANLKSSDGKTYELRLGPLWFWNKYKYELKAGQKADVKGTVAEQNGKLYLFPSTIIQNGKIIKLTGDTGVPLWSRRGNGTGKQGRNN
jgi:hypothetical protein